jgi:hypothetical protein
MGELLKKTTLLFNYLSYDAD